MANTTSLAANNGILVRSRPSLETSKDLNVIVFDKTGTLTEGEFGVVDMAISDSIDADGALAAAAVIEGESDHLIARAMGILAPWGIIPSPALGAFLMSISTVIVAINAQTLRRVEL